MASENCDTGNRWLKYDLTAERDTSVYYYGIPNINLPYWICILLPEFHSGRVNIVSFVEIKLKLWLCVNLSIVDRWWLGSVSLKAWFFIRRELTCRNGRQTYEKNLLTRSSKDTGLQFADDSIWWELLLQSDS